MTNLSALATHRFLLRAALAAGTVFAWILIYHALYFSGESKTGALVVTTFLYIISQVLTFILTPLSAQNLGHGTQRSILYATLAISVAYLWLAASSAGVFGPDVENLWWGIVGFAILTGVYRAFYWIPYRASSAPSTVPGTTFLLEVFLALLPLSASIVITGYPGGAWVMLVGVATLAFLASIPLTAVSEAYEPYAWTYGQTLQQLFSPINRGLFAASIRDGIQGAGLLFLWPLTIFLLLDWSYELLGLVMTVTLLLTVFGRKIVRTLLRVLDVHRSAPVTAAFAASSWILRLAVISPTTIVIADVLYHTCVPTKKFGIDHIAHEQAADGSHFVDERTALKEMGFATGRALLALIVMVFAFYASPLIALGGALFVSALASIVSIMRSASVR
ncbi:MAG: hypothetical protein G01um10148_872 [Parcubacteria group bacterium Gr01-1014_8]|nr:MAG: hypothetical protein G01um10148_872 [Parcubacteria group bacterium Gr01-1014_8]